MQRLMWYLWDRICYFRDQRGIETLEWILIGAIVTGAALVIYGTTMESGLNNTMGNIIDTIDAAST